MMGRLYELADALRHRARKRHMDPSQALGHRGEDIAHRFLRRGGMVIVARNYRLSSGAGEIDLVGWDRGTLVFVEVKTRESTEFGPPERAVGPEKWSHMLRAGRDFARHATMPWNTVRFDIVTVVMSATPAVVHLRDVRPEA